MDFAPGDVILFEDTIRPGHLLTVSKDSTSLTVLLITLPNKHHHIGKQHLSMKATLTAASHKVNPCIVTEPTENSSDKHRNYVKSGELQFETGSSQDSRLNASSHITSSPPKSTNTPALFADGGRRVRFFVFGTIAFSLSTLMADFLGRTAPLWLAVGVGGTCFVLSATYAITMSTDFIYTALNLWHERRKLERIGNKSSTGKD
jgi:hypothetical protein